MTKMHGVNSVKLKHKFKKQFVYLKVILAALIKSVQYEGYEPFFSLFLSALIKYLLWRI
jgi:hypothetical protein